MVNRRWRRSRTPRPLPGQRSFAQLAPDPGWASSRPPKPSVDAPQLLPAVRAQARRFETAVVEQGLARANSARTYRKALECLCKQAERHVGRPLEDIAELYDPDLIAAVAVDDEPFDGSTYQLSRYTLRQRRVVLTAYLRAIGVPGITFEAGQELIKRGLRRASDRRGYRYVIPAGRPELRDRYRPPLADVTRFLAAALTEGNAYVGARLAAAAALTLWHGLRPVSLLAIDGSDFSRRRGSLYLRYTEKVARNKPARREIGIRAPVAGFLQIYVSDFNSYAARMGSAHRIGLGEPGAFFCGLYGRHWRYHALLYAYARCCRAAGVTPFTAYGLRRLYAGGMAAVLSIEEAAVAGGWKDEHVFMRHYARSVRDWQLPLPLDEPAIDLNDDGPEFSRIAVHDKEVSHE